MGSAHRHKGRGRSPSSRARLCAVVPRKIFRTRAYPNASPTTGAPARAVAEPAAGTLTVLFNEDDYPWEFYSDFAPGVR